MLKIEPTIQYSVGTLHYAVTTLRSFCLAEEKIATAVATIKDQQIPGNR
jgi:hypothetical protein